MKTKRTFIPVFTLSVALLLTACNGKEAADTKKTQTTQTESGTEAVTGSVAESGTETAGASGTKLDDLYQQENQIFSDHADVWNKVFGMMNKSTADPSGNYGDYLADTVEANKDSFSEDELNTLTDDIATIRKIEEQIAEMENGNTASEDTDAKNDSEEVSPFRDFSGQDYDGNTVDESLFSKNAVTVVLRNDGTGPVSREVKSIRWMLGARAMVSRETTSTEIFTRMMFLRRYKSPNGMMKSNPSA